MNVYDFKGPGVAMAMYNTDEVGIVQLQLWSLGKLIADWVDSIVNYWFRAFVVQDGFG